ncbi:MAG: zinc ribbon domain-containing protein [Gemmatimonadetes bacterium]|nr:zinc ribbon domain-containing protein [Gemmatimonadota bacterium]
MNCPACGTAAAGNFCAKCGASLKEATCAACGAHLSAGARFCSRCGIAVQGEHSEARVARGRGVQPGPGMLGWWLAGVAMVVLIVVIAWPIVRPGRETGGAGGGDVAPTGGPATGGGGVDLSSMTPREAADRLFNRVMTAVSAGDTSQVRFFVDMAIQAYHQAQPLDADGYYHLSVLERTAGRADSALATARKALESAPDHLLALAAAAQAARDLGTDPQVRDYYTRFLAAYEAERARKLPEYEAHARQLPELLEEARGFVRPAR